MTTTEQAKRVKRARWPWIIVGLLGGHVTIMVVAVIIATNDRSFAVVPNYYQRAVNWDQTQAQKRASEKLGWHVRVEASNQVDPIGRRAMSFVLTDADGKALDHAVLEIEYFHDSHGDEEKQVKLTPDATDPSRFTVLLPMRYAGNWEFHFTATAGGKTFVAAATEFLSNTKAGGPA